MEHSYSRPGAWNSLDYHKPSVARDHLNAHIDLKVYYQMAFQMKIDPEAFHNAIDRAYHQIIKGMPVSEVASWLAWELDRLPKWEPVPDPPTDFCLVSFLQPYIDQLQPTP